MFSLFPFAPESLVSRDRFGCPVPRQPAHLHTQAESGAYSRDSYQFPRRRPHSPPTAIGSEFQIYRVTPPMVFTAKSLPAQGQVVLKVVE